MRNSSNGSGLIGKDGACEASSEHWESFECFFRLPLTPLSVLSLI